MATKPRLTPLLPIVLEHLWLKEGRGAPDYAFYKGLIQLAGGFVHLKLQRSHPEHPKHGRRLLPEKYREEKNSRFGRRPTSDVPKTLATSLLKRSQANIFSERADTIPN